MFTFIKKPKTIVSIIILAIITIAGYNYFTAPKKAVYDFVVAEKKNIVQEVSVTGKIKPAESIDLAFERTGKINNVYAKIGDRVKTGQTLASINNEEILTNIAGSNSQLENAKAQLAQYQAALERENANLANLKKGTRPEEIKIAETSVASAQKSLSDAQTNLTNVRQTAEINLANLYGKIKDILNDAYAKSDNAVNAQIADLFSNASTSNPLLTFIATDSQAKNDSEYRRVVAGDSLKNLKSEIDNLPMNYPGMDSSLARSKNQLIIIRDFLTRLSAAVNSAAGLTPAAIDAYKTSINTAWTNINTAITNINNQEQLIASQKITNQNNIDSAQSAINSAQNSLRGAEDSLALKKAGATPEQISAQEAQVKQAEANIISQKAQIKQGEASIENLKIQLAKSAIQSPINGIITKQEAKTGEIVSANIPVVSIISEAQFQIEANIAEADIAKVKINDPANITLDAYGGDIVFAAKVISVDPGETILEGVATYKTTFQFTSEDGRLKSGMTANITVITDFRQNVIAIPQRSVISKGEEKFVKILLPDNSTREVKVKTGLRGSEGEIEITEGINAGNKIITSAGI